MYRKNKESCVTNVTICFWTNPYIWSNVLIIKKWKGDLFQFLALCREEP